MKGYRLRPSPDTVLSKIRSQQLGLSRSSIEKWEAVPTGPPAPGLPRLPHRGREGLGSAAAGGDIETRRKQGKILLFAFGTLPSGNVSQRVAMSGACGPRSDGTSGHVLGVQALPAGSSGRHRLHLASVRLWCSCCPPGALWSRSGPRPAGYCCGNTAVVTA